MARYTDLETAEVEEIAYRYGLQMAACEPIEGGAANSSYVLSTAAGRYVLTVFDDKSWDEVVRLGRLLAHLDTYDFPSTPLVRARTGDIATDYKSKPVLVKQYIEGSVHVDLDDAMLSKAGRALARLHRIPVPDYIPRDHAYGAHVLPEILGCKIDLEFETWAANRLPALESRIPGHLPRGLIHGDLFYDNILYRDSTLAALIDFEEACEHYRVFDIGMAIVGTCSRENVVVFDKVRALLNGYEEIRQLENDERQILQTFVEYSAVATSCWRFWKYHIDAVRPEKRALHLDMQRLAEMVRRVPPSEFIYHLF
jgi:homoserine kinase type II